MTVADADSGKVVAEFCKLWSAPDLDDVADKMDERRARRTHTKKLMPNGDIWLT